MRLYRNSEINWNQVTATLQQSIQIALDENRQRGKVMDVRTRLDLTLTDQMKRKVKDFFTNVLQERRGEWPLRGVILYINGRGKEIMSGGYWQDHGDGKFYIGEVNTEPSREVARPHERLAIAAALINITGFSEDPEIVDLFTKATGRCLVGIYGQVVKPLVEPKSGRGQIREMAFSEAGIAARVNGEWVSFGGQPVDVAGSEWTKVEVEA